MTTDRAAALGAEKYGFMVKVTRFLGRVGPQGKNGLKYADTVVLVRLDG